MAMDLFVRQQKITNVVGRRDYIARNGRTATEDLVLFVEPFTDWQKLAEFEQSQSRETNEGRELIIALPNDMQSLSKIEQQSICDAIATATIGNYPHAYAIHHNAKRNNLHMHLLYSERQQTYAEKEPKRYRQDIWAKADGKRALKTADRHHVMHRKGEIQKDKDGNIKYKPAVQSGYTEKNPKFKSKTWLKDAKNAVEAVLTERGYNVTQYDRNGLKLAQKHVGKGNTPVQVRIRRQNADIVQLNGYIDEMRANNAMPKKSEIKTLKQKFIDEIKSGNLSKLLSAIRKHIYKVKLHAQSIGQKINNAIGDYAESTVKAVERLKGYANYYTSEHKRLASTAISDSNSLYSDSRRRTRRYSDTDSPRADSRNFTADSTGRQRNELGAVSERLRQNLGAIRDGDYTNSSSRLYATALVTAGRSYQQYINERNKSIDRFISRTPRVIEDTCDFKL